MRYYLWFRSNVSNIILRIYVFPILFILFAGCQPFDVNSLSLRTTEEPREIQSTPTGVEATSTSEPTRLAPVHTLTPTQKPEPKLYEHPDNIFELSIPTTWSVNSDGDSTTINDPVSGVKINIQIVNTVYELDPDSLARTVDAREANIFGEYESYLETDRIENHSDPSYLVEKSLMEDGEPKVIISQYRQSGKFVLVLDLWSGLDYYESNKAELSSILDSLSIDESMQESEDNTGSSLFTTFSNGSFSMEVPQYWHHRTASSDNSVVDTFSSPDENAVIQMVVYDDGERITGSVAGAFVRNLLRNYYAKDIVVTSYKYLPDGKEELIWYSSGSNYQGTTYFDAHDTELIIYTVMTAAIFNDIYNDLLMNALNSFQRAQSD